MSDWARTLDALLRERGDDLFGYAFVLGGSPERANALLEGAILRAFRSRRGSRSVDAAHAAVRRAIARAAAAEGPEGAQRACLVVHYLDDVPVEEVGAILGMSGAAAEQHLAAAVAGLRTQRPDLDFTETFTIPIDAAPSR